MNNALGHLHFFFNEKWNKIDAKSCLIIAISTINPLIQTYISNIILLSMFNNYNTLEYSLDKL